MIVAGTNLTDVCGATVSNMKYPDRTSAVWLATSNRGVLSFSTKRKPLIDRKGIATHSIELVTFAMKPGLDPAVTTATGRCFYGNPYEGPVRIVCEAKSAQWIF